MKEILVVVEHRQGEIRDITFEMMNFARKFANDGSLKITALLLTGDADMAKPLEKTCDEIIVVENSELDNYNADHYMCVLETVIKERAPRLIVIGHTAVGMDLAPALSIRTAIPLSTDCLDALLNDQGIEVYRQEYGGKVDSRLILKPSESCMITLRPGSFPTECGDGKSAIMTQMQAPPVQKALRGRKFIEYLAAEAEDVDITAASILVSIGRGIGKPENIPVIQEFVDAIGATMSCSRPVADKEWLPKSRQVGTSGKTVKPAIYIALGISGAFQHQAGMKQSGTIIAVNTDPAAPIFGIAHYGIIGDIMEVVPALTEKFKQG